MKQFAIVLLATFIAGCAAPPPVKIASKLLGRNVLHQAKDELADSDSSDQNVDR